MEAAAITAEAMQPYLDSAFTVVQHPDVSIQLVSIDEQKSGRIKSFALLFEGPADPQLAQGVWELNCNDESFSLFLVPVGPGQNEVMGYESVFSGLTA